MPSSVPPSRIDTGWGYLLGTGQASRDRTAERKAARNLGQGEKDRLILVSEGQKAQTEVLGTTATVQLQQYNTLMDKLFQFAKGPRRNNRIERKESGGG